MHQLPLKKALTILVVAAVLALAACGQKGDLYTPEDTRNPQKAGD
jgi:predicted small lipoprotein YifL